MLANHHMIRDVSICRRLKFLRDTGPASQSSAARDFHLLLMDIIADNGHSTPPPKKRRLHGACDACKKKKGMHLNSSCLQVLQSFQSNVRPTFGSTMTLLMLYQGDSAEMRDNRCTNCSISGIKCTHAIPRHPKVVCWQISTLSQAFTKLMIRRKKHNSRASLIYINHSDQY